MHYNEECDKKPAERGEREPEQLRSEEVGGSQNWMEKKGE